MRRAAHLWTVDAATRGQRAFFTLFFSGLLGVWACTSTGEIGLPQQQLQPPPEIDFDITTLSQEEGFALVDLGTVDLLQPLNLIEGQLIQSAILNLKIPNDTLSFIIIADNTQAGVEDDFVFVTDFRLPSGEQLFDNLSSAEQLLDSPALSSMNVGFTTLLRPRIPNNKGTAAPMPCVSP